MVRGYHNHSTYRCREFCGTDRFCWKIETDIILGRRIQLFFFFLKSKVIYIRILSRLAPGSGGERKTLSRSSRIAALILLCKAVIHASIISFESACNVCRLQNEKFYTPCPNAVPLFC